MVSRGKKIEGGPSRQRRKAFVGTDAVEHLRTSIAEGGPWFRALLTTVGMWSLAEEEVDGHHYQYLLLGEAFDWLVLAERLLNEVDGLVPLEEKESLLFLNKLPDNLSETEFRTLIGDDKYRAHLNYFYGVVVEESLLLAVEEEVRKQRIAQGLPDTDEVVERAYQRIYGEGPEPLLKAFQRESGRATSRSLSLTDLKEFTYWLFKRRISASDSSRVASDTKKGLERLFQLHAPPVHEPVVAHSTAGWTAGS